MAKQEAVKSGAQWLQQLKHPDRRLRGKASYFLGSITPRHHAMLRDLMAGATSRDADTRFWALTAIGRLKERAAPAVPLLIDALKDSKPANRQSAIDALTAIRSAAPHSVPQLIRVLRGDRTPFVRSNAAEALGTLGAGTAAPPAVTRAAVDALLAALNDRNEDVVYNAAISLKLLGRQAPFAAPAVAEALADPELDEGVRDQLASALKSMRRGMKKQTPARG